MKTIICIFYFKRQPKFLFSLFSKIENFKRNPRNLEYMKNLANKKFDNNYELIDGYKLSKNDLIKISQTNKIVLLWENSNGYHWFNIERKIFSLKNKDAKIMILNGRKRYFELNKQTWFRYLFVRNFERFWVGEILFTILFIIISPIIVIWDFIKKKF
jgi:hypothetical protein